MVALILFLPFASHPADMFLWSLVYLLPFCALVMEVGIIAFEALLIKVLIGPTPCNHVIGLSLLINWAGIVTGII